jgi:acyl-homoserine lactone acylase PvdQ
VPHVFADTLEGAYFGLGYCAAQDRPKTLPLHQLLVQGRLAQRLGNRPLPLAELPLLECLRETPFFRGYGEGALPLDSVVGVDRWMRNFDYYGEAEAGLVQLSDRSRTAIESYAAGVNRYFETHAPNGDEEAYQPATELAWWSWFEHTIAMGFFISNAFAVAASRTERGCALIGGDPHYWFLDGHSESHIVCPQLDLSGLWDGHVNLGFWGGTNRSLAVHITAAGLEGAAAYRERVNPADREEYWDWRTAAFRPFERVEHTIAVKDGAPVEFVARRSHHGPVVSEALFDGSPVAYAIKSPIDGNAGRRLDQWIGVWTCTTVDEFLAYATENEFVRSHRVCADREGNIGYVCNGPVAVRDDEVDWSRPVDGSFAASEWLEEGWRPGAQVHGLPKFTNPSCGFIQSANDPPWVSTVPGQTQTDFPRYVFPDGWRELGTRGARQREILAGTHKLTQRDAEELVLDIFVPKAFHGIRSLRAAVEEEGVDLSLAAAELDGVLAGWDGRATVDSVEMTIAFFLDRKLDGGLPGPRVEVHVDPTADPEIVGVPAPGKGRAYARALDAVAEHLTATYGSPQIAWGDIHAISRPMGDFGLPGGCNSLRALVGTWRGWWDVDDVLDPDGIERCNFGSRTLRLTEIGPERVRVRSLSLTGQMPAAEHAPDSPHALDQARLYAQLSFKDVPLDLEEIEAQAREEDHAGCVHRAYEEVVAGSDVGAIARS